MADRIRPEVRRHIQAFVQGINSYYESHPEDLPAWWGKRRVDEFMVTAFSRLFLQSYSFDDGFRDLKRAGIDPGIELISRGSNQFAVAPSRTAVGAPILLSDTHLPWDGPFRFWEFRIHAGGLRGSGFTLPGIPYIGLGHNENVAWAMTTGGPDTADVYELRLDGEKPTRYLYDGQWKELRERTYRVLVKGAGEQIVRLLRFPPRPAGRHPQGQGLCHQVGIRRRGGRPCRLARIQLRRRLPGSAGRVGLAAALPPQRDGGGYLRQHLLPAHRTGPQAPRGLRLVETGRRFDLQDGMARGSTRLPICCR